MKFFNTKKNSQSTLTMTFISTAIILSACAPELKPLENAPAPQSQEEVGYLVMADNTLVEEFRRTHDVSGRILNRSFNMHELFGVDAEFIKQEIPSAIIQENKYIENVHQTETKKASFTEMFLAQTQNDNKLEATSKKKLPDFGYGPCKIDRGAENPMADIAFSIAVENIGKVQKGTTIQFDANGSKSHPKHPSELKFGWMAARPLGSNVAPMKAPLLANQFEITTDTLGQYTVILGAQDNRGLCHFAGVRIGVTANPNYIIPAKKSAALPVDLESSDKLQPFSHLDQVKAKKAWINSNQGEGMLIAIVDSGVHYNHPDLAENIFINEKEIPGNGIDDDGNSLVDDVIGYDFVNDDNRPYDDAGHGTHVAGIAASTLFGIAPKAKILPVKSLSAFGGGDMGSLIAGVAYAAEMGADIINGSFGSNGVSKATMFMKVFFDRLEEKNVLFVAAAGNGHPQTGMGLNTDKMPHYPSSFKNENILSVASVDIEGQMARYSNFGQVSVDIAAPGGGKTTPKDVIVSAYIENPAGINYMGQVGTSMAAPVVAGAAALVKSTNPDLSPVQIKAILMDTTDKQAHLKGLMVSPGILNVNRAVQSSKVPSKALQTILAKLDK